MAEKLAPSDVDAEQFVEAYGSSNDPAQQHHSLLTRLYTGTGAFNIVGVRRRWYIASGVILAIALLSILIRGFTFGVDFTGGSKLNMPAGAQKIDTAQVEQVFTDALGFAPATVSVVGSGSGRMVEIQSRHLDNNQIAQIKMQLGKEFQPKDSSGHSGASAIGDSTVSNTWGSTVTKKALLALFVFLVVVSIYIAVRLEKDMAFASLASLLFCTVTTAGVYSLIGFEVTPATVIGLLTILAFSIYDTVVVFDKVQENTDAALANKRHTYAEGANLAINQTIMRSINTTIISVLPIIALMVVAVWMLGVGTLQDLALIQLVGVVTGTYSSIFLATPLLVGIKNRFRKDVQAHDKAVYAAREAQAATSAEAASAAATAH